MTPDVVQPGDHAVFRDALVVVVAFHAVRTFRPTPAVSRPRRRLVADEIVTALGVSLAYSSLRYAGDAHAILSVTQ